MSKCKKNRSIIVRLIKKQPKRRDNKMVMPPELVMVPVDCNKTTIRKARGER